MTSRWSSKGKGERKKKSEVAQLCPTLCDPVDCSLRGSSIHGIFQARILEWVAMSFSKGSSLTQGLNPGLQQCNQMILPSEPPRKQGKEEGGKTWSPSSDEEVDQVRRRPWWQTSQELPEPRWGPRVAPRPTRSSSHLPKARCLHGPHILAHCPSSSLQQMTSATSQVFCQDDLLSTPHIPGCLESHLALGRSFAWPP